MIPMTIHRRNAFQWLKFGLLELWRIIIAFCTGSGGREKAVAKYVENHARPGDAQSVIDAIAAFARDKRFLMNVGEEKGQFLMDARGDAPAQRVLELGAYCGYSAVLIGKGPRSLQSVDLTGGANRTRPMGELLQDLALAEPQDDALARLSGGLGQAAWRGGAGRVNQERSGLPARSSHPAGSSVCSPGTSA